MSNIVNPFKLYLPQTKEVIRAAVIRAMLNRRQDLLALDPWMAFPQDACCYSFGKDSRPLPIGALFHLWDHWPAMTGPCPKCNGRIYGFAFGGLLTIGGVIGCCLDCELRFYRHVGGIGIVADQVRTVLAGTPYQLTGGLFGGVFDSDGQKLLRTLRHMGVTDIP